MNKVTLSTSEKEVPKHKNALEEKYQHEEKEPLNPENIKEPRLTLIIFWNEISSGQQVYNDQKWK